MCRWVAKNIVAAGLARAVELQVAYAIGHPRPVSVSVVTFGTATVSENTITRAVNSVFSFNPSDIVKQLGLLRPIYRETTNYGHFGKPGLPWEQANKVTALRAAAKLK
jgi:S-adenosylmethionine synthetase